MPFRSAAAVEGQVLKAGARGLVSTLRSGQKCSYYSLLKLGVVSWASCCFWLSTGFT
jgi:hypothetical protein